MSDFTTISQFSHTFFDTASYKLNAGKKRHNMQIFKRSKNLIKEEITMKKLFSFLIAVAISTIACTVQLSAADFFNAGDAGIIEVYQYNNGIMVSKMDKTNNTVTKYDGGKYDGTWQYNADGSLGAQTADYIYSGATLVQSVDQYSTVTNYDTSGRQTSVVKTTYKTAGPGPDEGLYVDASGKVLADQSTWETNGVKELITESYCYDTAGRATTVTTTNGQGKVVSRVSLSYAASTSRVTSQATSNYDDAGVETKSNITSFTYNEVGMRSTQSSYSLDASGNQTLQSTVLFKNGYAVESANYRNGTAMNTTTYAYDANNRQLSATTSGEGVNQTTFNNRWGQQSYTVDNTLGKVIGMNIYESGRLSQSITFTGDTGAISATANVESVIADGSYKSCDRTVTNYNKFGQQIFVQTVSGSLTDLTPEKSAYDPWTSGVVVDLGSGYYGLQVAEEDVSGSSFYNFDPSAVTGETKTRAGKKTYVLKAEDSKTMDEIKTHVGQKINVCWQYYSKSTEKDSGGYGWIWLAPKEDWRVDWHIKNDDMNSVTQNGAYDWDRTEQYAVMK
jgi:hypothetical protein